LCWSPPFSFPTRSTASYEVYSEERLEEFRKAAEATPEEVAAFLEAWGLE
jgi:hypothetical protein